jgi:formate hydrogenlyase subunit 4
VIQGLAVILIMFLLPTGVSGLLRRVVAPLSNRIRNAS